MERSDWGHAGIELGAAGNDAGNAEYWWCAKSAIARHAKSVQFVRRRFQSRAASVRVATATVTGPRSRQSIKEADMTCTHSIIAIIAALACSQAVAQLGNAPPSALSAPGSSFGHQIQSAPAANAAGAAQSP